MDRTFPFTRPKSACLSWTGHRIICRSSEATAATSKTKDQQRSCPGLTFQKEAAPTFPPPIHSAIVHSITTLHLKSSPIPSSAIASYLFSYHQFHIPWVLLSTPRQTARHPTPTPVSYRHFPIVRRQPCKNQLTHHSIPISCFILLSIARFGPV